MACECLRCPDCGGGAERFGMSSPAQIMAENISEITEVTI